MRVLRDPLLWLLALFIAILLLLPYSTPLFSAVPRAAAPGVSAGEFCRPDFRPLLAGGAFQPGGDGGGRRGRVAVTRPAGREFRPLVETIAAMGQTFPPVAVLAIAVPVLGFGWQPALIALALYGILPVLQGTLAGLSAVPSGVVSIANGMGMTGWQRLIRVELPLAAPVMLAGIRTSTIVNIGTATIASTVGANTLGTPIVIGLSGFNTAYVIQGRCWSRWRRLSSTAALND